MTSLHYEQKENLSIIFFCHIPLLETAQKHQTQHNKSVRDKLFIYNTFFLSITSKLINERTICTFLKTENLYIKEESLLIQFQILPYVSFCGLCKNAFWALWQTITVLVSSSHSVQDRWKKNKKTSEFYFLWIWKLASFLSVLSSPI